jgi:hypothetical protein
MHCVAKRGFYFFSSSLYLTLSLGFETLIISPPRHLCHLVQLNKLSIMKVITYFVIYKCVWLGTAVTGIRVLCGVSLCRWASAFRRFERMQCSHLQGSSSPTGHTRRPKSFAAQLWEFWIPHNTDYKSFAIHVKCLTFIDVSWIPTLRIHSEIECLLNKQQRTADKARFSSPSSTSAGSD